MTTIIRANGIITNPQPGGRLIPSLAVTGVSARWHAAGQPVNGVIQSITDVSGQGRHLPVTSGAVSVVSVEGRLALSLGATGGNNVARIASIPGTTRKRSIAALMRVGGFPTGSSFMLATTDAVAVSNRSGVGLTAGAGTLCTYGTSGGVRTSSVATPVEQWFVAIGTFDDSGAAGANPSKIANNGVITEGVLTYAPEAEQAAFNLRGTSQINPRYIDVALFDHVLSNAEIATVTSAMLAQVSS